MKDNWSITRRGPVAVATFERPPENTMSFLALERLEPVLAALGTDDSISVVVITGGIAGYFIAHADLGDVGRMARGEPPEGDPDVFRRVLARLESLPQPVVAAVNGQAWGGGCELALACSFRIMARSAHFCQLEVSKGAIPGAGGTRRLPRLIGLSRALRLILTSQVVRAQEAFSLGLADAVVPDHDFMTHVFQWLAPLAAQPRHALVAAKAAVMQGLDMPLEQALDHEKRLFMQAITSKSFVEEPR